MAKRISIINFKGGVGKTTLAFHLGTGLAYFGEDVEEEGSRVLLVDMDHQSSLSLLCLGARGWEAAVNSGHTVDAVFRPFVGGEHALPGTEIIARSPMRRRVPDYDFIDSELGGGLIGVRSPMRHSDPDYDLMDLVPASLHLDDTEIELTASYQNNAIRSEWNKRTLLCRWLEETGIDAEYDYIIFDCPPATKIVSQNAIAASHGYIIPVVPEAVMERGAPHLRDMMRSRIDDWLKALAPRGDARSMYVPDTRLVGLVITQIQTSGRSSSGYTNDHAQHLRSLQSVWGSDLLEPYIVRGTGVSTALSNNLPVYNYGNSPNIGRREIHVKFVELMFNIKRRIDAL